MEKLLIGILAMASVVVASNILVQFLLLDGLLTWGAFTYPIAFLITDLMNKIYGYIHAGPFKTQYSAHRYLGNEYKPKLLLSPTLISQKLLKLYFSII